MSGLHATTPLRHRSLGLDASQQHQVERAAAYVATFVLGSRLDLHPVLPLGYAAALAALPVTLGVAARYRGARLIVALAALAALAGILLTWTIGPPGSDVLSRTAVGQGLRILMVGAGALLLLWARLIIGSRPVVMTYALGIFASLGVVGVNPLNAWKFSFAVPISLLVLSLPFIYRRAWAEAAGLLALGALSALQDSRSAAATMLIASALVITRPHRDSARSSAFAVLTRLGLFGAGSFYLVQSALLNGDLGEDARQRTMAQIETSGSVLLGGRPELGATWALLSERPWGYGIGAQPTPTQIDTAKAGMASLNYDPDNGYVENYMFGDGFEVHSVVGDLWLLGGLLGLALGLATIGYVVWGMAHQLGQATASGVMVFLTVRALWDIAFAPLYSALPLLMLCVALALPERAPPPPGARSA